MIFTPNGKIWIDNEIKIMVTIFKLNETYTLLSDFADYAFKITKPTTTYLIDQWDEISIYDFQWFFVEQITFTLMAGDTYSWPGLRNMESQSFHMSIFRRGSSVRTWLLSMHTVWHAHLLVWMYV